MIRSARRVVPAALVLLVACSSGGAREAEQKPTVPVAIAPVVQKDAPVTLRAIGTVEPYSTVSLKPQIEGRLERVAFREGQEVHEGDLLFRIDRRPFEAALREAEANRARDRAQAENARVEAGRFARLIDSGVVSSDEYDQANTRARAFEAAVQGDEAALEKAHIQLQYCDITSPLGGRIGRLLVHEGDVVKANETTLAVINQIRPVWVSFSVPQHELGEVRRRLAAGEVPVQASVRDDRAAAVPGALRFVNNEVDTRTGTVLLKAEFANPDEVLWPGQFADVVLTLSVRSDALLVPARAVQTGQDGAYVFVVQADQTVASRAIKVSDPIGADVVVMEGLAAGEQVVTDGQLRLAPGMRVEAKDG